MSERGSAVTRMLNQPLIGSSFSSGTIALPIQVALIVPHVGIPTIE